MPPVLFLGRGVAAGAAVTPNNGFLSRRRFAPQLKPKHVRRGRERCRIQTPRGHAAGPASECCTIPAHACLIATSSRIFA